MSPFSLSEMMIMMVCILRVLQAACPPGWLTWQDSCYILLPKKMNWFDAKKACERPGVSLVLPNSVKEHFFLWEEMSTRMRELGPQSSDDLQLWINCNRNYEEDFLCSGYEGNSSFRNWGNNEPNNRRRQACVRMAGIFGGKMGDRDCDFIYFVACEMSALAYGSCLAVGDMCRQSSRRYIRVPQQCLLNHQIKSYQVKESFGCGQACLEEPLCRSFNIRKQADNKKICQLNYASHTEADVTDIKYEKNCYFYEP